MQLRNFLPKSIKPLFKAREKLAAIFPEHLGDIFFIFMIAALAGGAIIFWLIAWLPSVEIPSHDLPPVIPTFSDTELDEITKILEARTEASTAPVVPPNRDPFR